MGGSLFPLVACFTRSDPRTYNFAAALLGALPKMRAANHAYGSPIAKQMKPSCNPNKAIQPVATKEMGRPHGSVYVVLLSGQDNEIHHGMVF